MRYSTFTDALLRALYFAGEESGTNPIKFDKLADHYGIEFRPGWLFDAQKEFLERGLLIGPSNARNDEQAIGRLTGAGKRHVEQMLDEMEAEPNKTYIQTIDPLEAESDKTIIRDYVDGEVIPASNRIVGLDHNDPVYGEIAQGLDQLVEQVRTDNEVGETAEDRDRLLRSLSAAKELWAAAELQVIQVKVGVIMAIEDARAALVKVGKAMIKDTLIDLIKGYIKSKIGLDL